jgi:DNA-binding PadR family transcriptional regulator
VKLFLFKIPSYTTFIYLRRYIALDISVALHKGSANQGFLQLMVVQQLSQQPTSGYALVKRIHERTGWKPSYGSIYPLLEKLEQDGFVTVAESGRSKLYTLTESGKKQFQEQQAVHEQAFNQIIEQMKILHSLGHEHCGVMVKLMQEEQQTGTPFKDLPEAVLMRNEMFRLYGEGKMKTKNKEMRAILKRAHSELSKL